MVTDSILKWTVYEITTKATPIHGVMLRGRLRKLALQNNFNLLAENATDQDNCVRFAVSNEEDAVIVIDFLKSILEDVSVTKLDGTYQNPVLSKLKVNIEARYTLKDDI